MSILARRKSAFDQRLGNVESQFRSDDGLERSRWRDGRFASRNQDLALSKFNQLNAKTIERHTAKRELSMARDY